MDETRMERARALAAQAAAPQQDVLAKSAPGPADLQNPAARPGRTTAERRRIPMSVPVQRLEVPEIPGYHLHWFMGRPDRIERAQAGGYEFVTRDEVSLNNVDLGGESAQSGSTDMGDRVSVTAGGEVEQNGQPGRLYLMKIRLEYWLEDQETFEDRNEQVAQALRGGQVGTGRAGGETRADAATRYVREAENLFTRKKSPRR